MEEARALRSRISGLEMLVRDALHEQQSAKERLDRAVQIAANSEDEKIQKLCKERHNQHASRVLILEELERSVEEERHVLQRESAHLAQSALLNFIRSKRYTLSPLNFAQAMAGLPYISWRRSISRCKEHQIAHPYGFEFETFQEAGRALKELPKNVNEAFARVEAYLTSKRHRNSATERLRRDWYYFREAIETVLSNRPLRSALPFAVFAEYQRRMSSQTTYDLEMAETDQLSYRP
jgi:hypothetical protein